MHKPLLPHYCRPVVVGLNGARCFTLLQRRITLRRQQNNDIMKTFATLDAMIAWKAGEQHEANLARGGCFAEVA
jgi:hypothetical protein